MSNVRVSISAISSGISTIHIKPMSLKYFVISLVGLMCIVDIPLLIAEIETLTFDIRGDAVVPLNGRVRV